MLIYFSSNYVVDNSISLLNNYMWIFFLAANSVDAGMNPFRHPIGNVVASG